MKVFGALLWCETCQVNYKFDGEKARKQYAKKVPVYAYVGGPPTMKPTEGINSAGEMPGIEYIIRK
jgi:hypothetical protein